MPAEPLRLGGWECAATPAGAVTEPSALPAAGLEWLPATVPGTAGAALAAAGRLDPGRDLDTEDWWWRTRVPVLPGDPDALWLLRFGGIATLAEVWVGGRQVAASADMFLPVEVALAAAELSDAVVSVRCAALTGAPRRPRPRWKTRLVADQSLRWRRTTLIGRMPGWSPGPAPVGPWRPVTLTPAPPVRVTSRRLATSCDGDAGRVRVGLSLTGPAPRHAAIKVGEYESSASVTVKEADCLIEGEVAVPDAQRWWPHTHGGQPLYDVAVDLGDAVLPLGRVGFREVAVDTAGGGFAVQVNGVPVFARGACWLPLDELTLAEPAAELRRTLQVARDGGMNLVRVTGVGVYPTGEFYDICDELGLLVWQDLMFANLDPPDDPEFVALVRTEIAVLAPGWQGHPSLAVVCGGSEVAQQATYFGLPADRRALPLLEQLVPAALSEVLPDLPYLPTTPYGGTLPTRLREGVTHYFGVGAYRRPLSDVRIAGVRFAAECLAFATPPESAAAADIDQPWWRRGTPRDNLPEGVEPWDFGDVRDHYVGLIYHVDPAALRVADPGRYLELGRAAVCEAMTAVFAEWRRPGSGCAGGIVLALRDLVPGPGWGLLDATGRPKAPWWALQPLLAPVALFTTDEGLDGILVHAVNDTAAALAGTVTVEVVSVEGHVTDQASTAVTLPPRGGCSVDVEEIIGAFRDLNGAHRFGPAPQGCLVARLEGYAEWVAPLAGPGRPRGAVGLAATLHRDGDAFAVEVAAERFAERVHLDVPGWHPTRNWFHLPAGRPLAVPLQPLPGAAGPPTGWVRAVNASDAARF